MAFTAHYYVPKPEVTVEQVQLERNMLTVYTKNNCPFCVQAKTQLDEMGFEYTEINIEEQPSGRDFLQLEGHRTVPQIYNGAKLLVEGGASGLASLTKQDIKEKLGDIEGVRDFKL